MTVHECRLAEIRQADPIPNGMNRDGGSGEMNMERQVDTRSGEPGQKNKLESKIVIGKCSGGSCISQTEAPQGAGRQPTI